MNKRLTIGSKFKPLRHFYCSAISHFDVVCDGSAGADSGRAIVCVCQGASYVLQHWFYILFGMWSLYKLWFVLCMCALWVCPLQLQGSEVRSVTETVRLLREVTSCDKLSSRQGRESRKKKRDVWLKGTRQWHEREWWGGRRRTSVAAWLMLICC